MVKSDKNRQLILDFYKSINGIKKTKDILSCFTTDPGLTEQILFFEKLFPEFELVPEEITTEQDRVIVRAHFQGKYKRADAGNPGFAQIFKTIFVIGYKLENHLIIDHWFVTDRMMLLQQMGLVIEVT